MPEKEICLFLPKSKWVLGAPIPPALLKLLTTDAHLSCNNVSVAQQEMNVGHHDGAISHPDLANLATISPLFSLLAVVSCSALFTCSRDSRKAQWGKSLFFLKVARALFRTATEMSQHISRSAHHTPNFTNPDFFVYLLFEYSFQIKVLN